MPQCASWVKYATTFASQFFFDVYKLTVTLHSWCLGASNTINGEACLLRLIIPDNHSVHTNITNICRGIVTHNIVFITHKCGHWVHELTI